MGQHDDGRHDFDFLFGRWRIHNRRLVSRLDGCTEWREFQAMSEARPILGGMGNVDTFSTSHFPDGKPLEGFTLRIFDPAAATWSIWWSDDRSGQLQPPVVGRFRGDHGEFAGEDLFAGRPIRVRFDWTRGAVSARWEQAFSPDGGETWETNWVMDLTRVQR